jgi:peptide chain release factor 1
VKQSIITKLDQLIDRHEEISRLLSEVEIQSDQNQFRALSQEYGQISSIVECYESYRTTLADLADSEDMLSSEDDPEMKEMLEAELKEAKETKAQLETDLQILLLPKDPDDTHNTFLEIRAGAGGAEAAIFAGNLFRAYVKYAEKQRWETEILNESHSEQGGYKEVICRFVGTDVYSRLKFESGAHRVQRVPETESQGRIHTSTCTVAIIPEADAIEAEEINMGDVRVDTYRASGAGGQHINKTDSAVRLTHIPTGIVIECQDERSQHKNKARALSVLAAKILAGKKDKLQQEQADERKSLVGTGDRSERIRTYNYPQGRMTDHRINLTLYKLDEIMEGHFDYVIEPLIREHQTEMLTQLGKEE